MSAHYFEAVVCIVKIACSQDDYSDLTEPASKGKKNSRKRLGRPVLSPREVVKRWAWGRSAKRRAKELLRDAVNLPRGSVRKDAIVQLKGTDVSKTCKNLGIVVLFLQQRLTVGGDESGIGCGGDKPGEEVEVGGGGPQGESGNVDRAGAGCMNKVEVEASHEHSAATTLQRGLPSQKTKNNLAGNEAMMLLRWKVLLYKAKMVEEKKRRVAAEKELLKMQRAYQGVKVGNCCFNL